MRPIIKMKSVIALCMLWPALAISTEIDDTKFKWSGIVSQSLVKTSDGTKLSGDSDNKYGSMARSEIALIGSYQATENVDFRAMGSVIQDGNNDGTPRLNYGLVDIHTDDGMKGIRIGRYSYEYGFYSATRNNPLYRDMELPPQGMYRDGFKYMTRSGDGVQLYLTHHLSNSNSFEVDAGVGRPTLYPPQDLSQTFVLDKNAGEFTSDSNTVSFNFTFRNRPNGIVVKYGYLMMDYKFKTPYIKQGEAFPLKAHNHYIGVRKYFEFGDLTYEIMQTYIGTTDWDRAHPVSGYNWGGVQGQSITYKHYITDKVSAIVGYDVWYTNKSDKHGNGYELATYRIVPSASMYHESINLGLIYRTHNFAVKGELHHVKGTNTIRADGNNIQSLLQPERYNVGMITVTYRFK